MGKLVQTGSKVTAKSGFTTTAAKQSGTTAAAKTAAAKPTAAKTAPAVVAQGKSGKLVQTGAAAAKSGFTTTPVSGNSAKTSDALTAAIVTANQKAAQTAAEKKASSPMFRAQTGTQQTVTPKTQSTLAQNLAQGALQQQEAKNYQSEEAFQKHVQDVKEPTAAQRVANTIKGAAKTYGAGLANAGGTVAESQSGTGMSGVYRTQAETLQKQIAALQKTLSDPTMTAKEREETREAIANAQSQLSIYTNALRSGENTASSVYKVADRLQISGEKDISKAKDRLGSAGRLAVDVGTAGAQMLGDMALGAATGGTALAPMAARVFGSSAQEARNAGATHTQQVNYGLTSAALSAATEKVANVAAPFRKAFGGGVLDSAIDRAMTKMNGSAAGKAALSFLSEGGEEVLEDIVQPVLKSIYNGKSIWKNWSELELADVLYDGLVGGVLGLLGSGAEAVTRGRAAETQDVGAGARQAVNEGNFTPAQENAAEGAQNASAADSQGNVRFESKEAPSPASDGASALSGDIAHAASGDASTDTVQAPDKQRGGNHAPADLPGSIGAARAGYQAPDTEPTERTSNLAGSAARYTQAEGEATTRSREDYDELFRYRAQSEEESRAKADDLVYIEKDGERQFLKDADPAAYDELVQYLSYAPAWNAQMVDAAMLIKEELQGRSIAMEITEDEYTHWLEVMREHATETGRGTQAWAKYSRAGNESGQASEADAWEKLQKSGLSDEERGEKFRSILLYDQRIEKARSPEDLKAVILEIAQERGVLSGITGRQSKSLYRAAEASLGSMDFVQLRQFAYESSAAMASDAQTRDIGKKLKTVQILNMLSNPKTAMKNLAGNTTFYALDMMSMRGAAVLDMALSKLTGTRSVAFEKPVMSRESRESIMKALRLSAAEITMDVDMGASGRYEQSGNRTFKAGGKFAERVLSVCERNMGYLMTATDEAYKGAARGTQRGTQELIEQEKIKNAPKDYAASQADELAKYGTFQNDSLTADVIQSLYDILNALAGVGDSGRKTKRGHTIHSFGAGDLVAPFTRVAGNLAGVGLDYSPVNAVKGTVEIVSAVADAAKNGANPVKQAKAVSDLARGMTGTAIAYGFMLLAKEGLLKRADDEDDKDIAELNKSEGMTGAQINLSAARRWLDGDESGAWQYGDTLVDLSNLEPLNFMVSLGADMAQEDSGSILSPFVATKDSILSAAGDLPVLQTVGSFAKDVFKYGTPVEQAAAEAVGKSAISSATPNVLAAIAKGIDEKQRNVYADDGTGDVLIATLKSRIPKVRETLPTTVNTLGEEKSNEGSLAERLINALLNPIGVNRYTQSEVSKEMERVREKTGETGYYPTTRKPDELSYKDSDGKEHTVTLDYGQKQAFQKACATGQMAYTAAMMETDTYKAADDETRAGLLSRCYTYSYEAAKAGVLGDGAVDKWVVHARDAQSELGMSTADYLAALETYGSGVMSGTGFDKTKRMLDAGLSLDDWAKMRESVDADGNGSVKKAELTGYIEANFPQEQWSALFDAYKGGQNWKNPY